MTLEIRSERTRVSTSFRSRPVGRDECHSFVSLFKARSAAHLRAIADGVHEALTAAYAVPPDDRFQIIEQREPGEIVTSPTDLGIERTDGLVIVQIIAGHWRDAAAKQALYRILTTDKLVANPGLRREDVQVIITSNDKAD